MPIGIYKRKIGEAQRGEKSYLWKGGLTDLQKMEKIAGRKKPEQCEVCSSLGKESKKGIVFDHDHNTGKFRGWICNNCNIVLSMVKDNPETLYKLIEYINKFY